MIGSRVFSSDGETGRRDAAAAAVCARGGATRIDSSSPFSTSKFDVGQINTLRPATFEVVRVDSGRPVNIGAIVPQRVAAGSAPFEPQAGGGGFSLLPGAPLRAAGDFWTFLSFFFFFFVKIRVILRAFHERAFAASSKDAIIAIRSLIHSFIHSITVPLHGPPSLLSLRTCHSRRYPAKNRRIIQSATHGR